MRLKIIAFSAVRECRKCETLNHNNFIFFSATRLSFCAGQLSLISGEGCSTLRSLLLLFSTLIAGVIYGRVESTPMIDLKLRGKKCFAIVFLSRAVVLTPDFCSHLSYHIRLRCEFDNPPIHSSEFKLSQRRG